PLQVCRPPPRRELFITGLPRDLRRQILAPPDLRLVRLPLPSDGRRFANATDLPLPHPEVDHRLECHIFSGGEAFAGADPREPRRRLEAEAMLAYVPRDGAAPAGLAPPLWPRGGNLD